MKMFQKTAVLSAALLLSSGVALAAAPTGELKVAGQLAAPSCTVSVSNGGTIDYGTIDRTTLSATEDNQLGRQTLADAFTVSCVNPTQIGFTATDNRYDSRGGNTANSTISARGGLIVAPGYGTGLGFDASGNKLGSYSATMGLSTVDGVSGSSSTWWLVSTGGRLASGWAVISSSAVQPAASHSYIFSLDGSTPATGRVFTASYSVSATLAPTSRLNMNNDIVLDGSVTIQVNYL